MLSSALVLLIAQSDAFSPAADVQVSCLENLRGKVGRAKVEIVVGAGALDEGENERGVAHLLEHLLMRPLNFDDGNATTSWDFTSYYREVTGGELDQEALALLRAVRDATFDQHAFETEQKIVLRELDVRGVSVALGIDPIFGDTLLARMPGGDAASVLALTADDARSFHRRFYTKGNIAVIIRGAVDCAATLALLTPELQTVAHGGAASTPRLREPEPGARSLSHLPGHFTQGFYWFDASPQEEVVWRLLAEHLEQRALDDLRKERGITYSPQGTFDRRGYGGHVALSVRTEDADAEVADWYDALIGALRSDPDPRKIMAAAFPQVRKELEADNVRAGLAAIRNETQPIEILDALTTVELQASLQLLLNVQRSFGTATPESNVASLIILGIFGAIVLAVLWIAFKRLSG